MVLSIGIAASYVPFAVLAAMQFPHDYGPWDNNTLSQLGNPNLNPDGYHLYFVGCALAGVFAIAFFLSLGRWRMSATENRRRLILLVQSLGVLAGFGLLMAAIFPENDFPQHHFWAGLLFNASAAAAVASIPALWRAGRSNAGLVAINLTAFAAVLLMFIFAPVHWVEWLPGGIFLLLPILLGVRIRNVELRPAVVRS